MSRARKIGIIALVVIIAGAGFFVYRKYAAAKNGKSDFKKDKVTRGDINRVIEQTGIIKSQVGAQVKVGTRATGTLMQLKYQVGDRVKKDALIAVIDDRQIRADIDSATASVASAEQNHRLVKDSYPLKIAEQESQVKSARVQADYAAVNFKRNESLFGRGFATQDEVDRAKKEFDVYTANFQQAQATLERMKDEYRKQFDIAKASVDQAKARLAALEISLTYTKIYAPISGIVSQVSTQEGEMVVSGLSTTNLITIIDPSRLEIWIYVDETDIGKVKEGMTVEYWVDAYRERRFKGVVGSIYPQPEVKDNVVYYLATVKVDPRDAAQLRPEMTAHVRVLSETKEGVLLVPNQAVKFEKGDYIVLVPRGEKREPVTVKIGVRDEKNTEILSGLKENDPIVVETPAAAPKSGPPPAQKKQ